MAADRPPTRRRLVFAHGPWQALMATAAVRQAHSRRGDGRPTEDVLVLYPLGVGPSTPHLDAVMEQLAGATWPWHRVLRLPEPVRSVGGPAAARAIASLRGLVGSSDAAEVWVDCLWGPLGKAAAEAFPGAGIVLYEDGLHTFVDAEDLHLSIGRFLGGPRSAARLARIRLGQWRRPEALDVGLMLRRHLDRVIESYLWIDQVVPAPPYQRRLPRVRLQTEHVRRTIEEASAVTPRAVPASGADEGRDPRPRAIVLGQCFSNYGDLDRDREFGWYRDTAIALRRAGFSVLWKEHPRTIRPFLPELSREVDGIEAMPELGPWPIELFADQLGLSCCVAFSSTSLFSFPLLFGLPSYTMINEEIKAHFRPPNDQMARLIVDHVPPVARAAALPAGRAGEADPVGDAAVVGASGGGS